jgi:hypothetical protein
MKRSPDGILTTHVGALPEPSPLDRAAPDFAAILSALSPLVGRDSVMAGTDCGFGWRSNPEIAWAKLRALVEGAGRATRALKYR